MTGTAKLYHPLDAPDGQLFDTDGVPQTSYADEG